MHEWQIKQQVLPRFFSTHTNFPMYLTCLSHDKNFQIIPHHATSASPSAPLSLSLKFQLAPLASSQLPSFSPSLFPLFAIFSARFDSSLSLSRPLALRVLHNVTIPRRQVTRITRFLDYSMTQAVHLPTDAMAAKSFSQRYSDLIPGERSDENEVTRCATKKKSILCR